VSVLYVDVICFHSGLLELTLLPTGCWHSHASALEMADATQLESAPPQLTLSFAAINCAASE
jgi:hypothetical protein